MVRCTYTRWATYLCSFLLPQYILLHIALYTPQSPSHICSQHKNGCMESYTERLSIHPGIHLYRCPSHYRVDQDNSLDRRYRLCCHCCKSQCHICHSFGQYNLL